MKNEPGFRDAIHVPYIVVQCNEVLQPGDKCSLRQRDDEHDTYLTTHCVKWSGKSEDVEPMWHGVADPFSETPIPAGTPFPLYIRKECFSGLRHDFQIEVHDRGGTETCHQVCDIF